jgi:hypothetical protein
MNWVTISLSLILASAVGQASAAGDSRDSGNGHFEVPAERLRPGGEQSPPERDFRRAGRPPEGEHRPDGRLTEEERRDLRRDIDRANREIYKDWRRP